MRASCCFCWPIWSPRRCAPCYWPRPPAAPERPGVRCLGRIVRPLLLRRHHLEHRPLRHADLPARRGWVSQGYVRLRAAGYFGLAAQLVFMLVSFPTAAISSGLPELASMSAHHHPPVLQATSALLTISAPRRAPLYFTGCAALPAFISVYKHDLRPSHSPRPLLCLGRVLLFVGQARCRSACTQRPSRRSCSGLMCSPRRQPAHRQRADHEQENAAQAQVGTRGMALGVIRAYRPRMNAGGRAAGEIEGRGRGRR